MAIRVDPVGPVREGIPLRPKRERRYITTIDTGEASVVIPTFNDTLSDNDIQDVEDMLHGVLRQLGRMKAERNQHIAVAVAGCNEFGH